MSISTKSQKFSLVRLATHDFRRALRIWRKNHSPLEIVQLLVEQRKQTLSHFVKAMGFSLVLSFWINNDPKSLDVNIYSIDLSIPSVYVNFTLCVLIFLALIGFLNYIILNEFVRVASDSLFRFDSPWALTTLFEGNSAWSSTFMVQFRFLKSANAHVVVSIASIFITIVPIIFTIIFLYSVSIQSGLTTIKESGVFSTETALIVIGWGMAIYPLLILVIINVQFRFKKNTYFIRWNFLYPLHRRLGSYPIRASEWYEEDK